MSVGVPNVSGGGCSYNMVRVLLMSLGGGGGCSIWGPPMLQLSSFFTLLCYTLLLHVHTETSSKVPCTLMSFVHYSCSTLSVNIIYVK